MSWDRRFFDPIELPGRKLLRDAAEYITELPKAEHDADEWQAAMQVLLLVAEHDGPAMFARIGLMKALNRHVERVFSPSPKLSDEVETQRDQWDWQTMKIRSAAIAFALLVDPSFASATDSICEAIAMRTTTKTENLYALKQGQTIDAITQYNVDKKTGAASLCSHGGGCYPADSLRLINCSINKSKPQYVDDNEVSYGLELIRSKVSPAKLRQNDVELKLLDIGMCSACADNAAVFYVKMPNSRCATLVRQALEGEPTAMAKLKDMPDYCSE